MMRRRSSPCRSGRIHTGLAAALGRWGVEKNVELLGVRSFHRLFPGKEVRNDMIILNENT